MHKLPIEFALYVLHGRREIVERKYQKVFVKLASHEDLNWSQKTITTKCFAKGTAFFAV